MAAVAVVVLVTAVNNFQKEAQFRELNEINEDIQARTNRTRVMRCYSALWQTSARQKLPPWERKAACRSCGGRHILVSVSL